MSLPVLPDLSATWKSRVFGEGDVPNQNVNGSEVITALPDTERLAFIGDAIVHLGLTNWLHERYPQHRQSLRTKLSDLSSDKPREWAMLYKLSSYAVVSRTQARPRPTHKGDLFRAYIGAVYLDRGGDHGGGAITSRWIKEIMEFEGPQAHKSDDDKDSDDSTDALSTKGKEGDVISGMLDSLRIPSEHPVQKPNPVPHVPISIPTSNSRNSLSILNEKASQKKSPLDWDDDSSGPDHAKAWTSKLTVEGKEFTGAGQNKKQARNIAAEIALTALKWK